MKLRQLEDLIIETADPILLRTDYNVPLDENQKIVDTTRIDETLPTIKFLQEKRAKIIILSHLGRPKNCEPALSLKPVADYLSTQVVEPVYFHSNHNPQQILQLLSKMQAGSILILENIRYNPAEEDPLLDPTFAHQLASLAKGYVNDAFGCAHRAHSSIVEVAKLFGTQAVAGRLLQKEVKAAYQILSNPKRPFYAIIGGIKISTKIGVLNKLFELADGIAIVGGLAYTFLKAQQIDIGLSPCDQSKLDFAQTLIEKAKAQNKLLLLPLDSLTINKIGDVGQVVEFPEPIETDKMGIDLGPKSLASIFEQLKNGKTIFWNGPCGFFENDLYAKSTLELAKWMAKQEGFTIVGGGDSLAALEKAQVKTQIDHASTGGGALLEFIEYGNLPGVDILRS